MHGIKVGGSGGSRADIFFRHTGGRALQKIPDRAAAAASTLGPASTVDRAVDDGKER